MHGTEVFEISPGTSKSLGGGREAQRESQEGELLFASGDTDDGTTSFVIFQQCVVLVFLVLTCLIVNFFYTRH